MLVILQIFPVYQTVDPIVSALPLIIIVTMTAAKDGFEDWRRHQTDEQINNQTSTILKGWENVNANRMEQMHRVGLTSVFSSKGRLKLSQKIIKWKSKQALKWRALKRRKLIDQSAPPLENEEDAQSVHVSPITGNPLPDTHEALTLPQKSSSLEPMDDVTNSIRANDSSTPNMNTSGALLNVPQSIFLSLDYQIPNPTSKRHPPSLHLEIPPSSDTQNLHNGTPSLGGHHVSLATDSESNQGASYASFNTSEKSTNPKSFWGDCLWKDLKVGDVILLKNNDAMPADILILSTSEKDCLCFVESKNLDGETNLKIRHGLIETSHLKEPEEFSKIKLRVDSEEPNSSLYHWTGTVTIPPQELINFENAMSPLALSRGHTTSMSIPIPLKSPSSPTGVWGSNGFKEASLYKTSNLSAQRPGKSIKVPVSINSLLLRGCILRNTEWVIGLIITTGDDTKLRMNAGITPSKRSLIEKRMNPQV